MAYESAKCPSCDANIQVPNDLESVTCDYCNSIIKTKAAISYATVQIEGEVQVKGIIDIEHLLNNAKTNILFNRNDVALKIYKDITDTYPSDWRAWYGILSIMSDNFKKLIIQLDFEPFCTILNNILLLNVQDSQVREQCIQYSELIQKYTVMDNNIQKLQNDIGDMKQRIETNEKRIVDYESESDPSTWLTILWFSLLVMPFIIYGVLSAGYWDSVLITVVIIMIIVSLVTILCSIAWGMKVKTINQKTKELKAEIKQLNDNIETLHKQLIEEKDALTDLSFV